MPEYHRKLDHRPTADTVKASPMRRGFFISYFLTKCMNKNPIGQLFIQVVLHQVLSVCEVFLLHSWQRNLWEDIVTHPAQGRFLPHRICKYCGAGKHNQYQHDKNCLRNVPTEGAALWHRGYDEQLAGKVREVAPGDSGLLYLMGVACAARIQVNQVPA